jgi:hypothetical protein
MPTPGIFAEGELVDYLVHGKSPKKQPQTTKQKTYYVFYGLSSDGIETTITRLRGTLLNCWNRKSCANFAMSQEIKSKSPHETGHSSVQMPGHDFKVTQVRVANGHGKVVKLWFVQPIQLLPTFPLDYENEMVDVHRCRRRPGKRRSFEPLLSGHLSVHPNMFFKTFYPYLHMKLSGICTGATSLDSAEVERLDLLEDHVKSIQAALMFGPPPAASAEKRPSPEEDSPAKRQKTKDDLVERLNQVLDE